MQTKPFLSLLAHSIVLCLVLGCGTATAPTAPGTSGRLTAMGDALAEMQLTVFQSKDGAFASLGMAVTDWEGRFGLTRPQGDSPLWLEPGDYVFCIQTAGSPYEIPAKYQDPKTSTLKASIFDGKLPIDLNIPERFNGE